MDYYRMQKLAESFEVYIAKNFECLDFKCSLEKINTNIPDIIAIDEVQCFCEFLIHERIDTQNRSFNLFNSVKYSDGDFIININKQAEDYFDYLKTIQ